MTVKPWYSGARLILAGSVLGWAALIALVLLPSCARADTWVVATLGSHHFNTDTTHCEKNPGLGLEHKVAHAVALMAGQYKNSVCRQSMYAGVIWQPLRLGEIRFGAAAGAVTGYLSHPYPLVVPRVSWEHERFGINIFFAPRAPSIADSASVVGLQVKYDFWKF